MAAVGLLVTVQVASGSNGVPVQSVPSGAVLRTVVVGTNPTAMAIDAQTARAFVLTEGALGSLGYPIGPGRVSVLDTHSGGVVRTVAAGTGPLAVAVDDTTGRVFVVNEGSFSSSGLQAGTGSVSVLDARTGHVVRTVTVGAAPGPIAVDRQAGRVFVANDWGGACGNYRGTVSILDAGRGRLLHTVPVGVCPASVAVDAPLGRVFVANFVSNTVSVLDARGGRLLQTITLGPSPGTVAALAVDERTQRVLALSFPPRIAGGGGSTMGHVTTLDAATGRVVRVVAVQAPNALGLDQRTGHAFVTGSLAHGGRVSLLDTRSGTVLRSIQVPIYPGAVAVDPASHRAFVVTSGALDRRGVPHGRGSVVVLDTRAGVLRCTIAVGTGPTAVAVDARTTHVFVVNRGDNSVSMLRATC
jgi:YVTN family beta-propeller protein